MISFTGKITYANNWYSLCFDKNDIDEQIIPLLEAKYGIEKCNVSNNFHISIIKDEMPSLKIKKFGKSFVDEKVTINIDDETLHDLNGSHVWFEIENNRLCEIREFFGVPCVKSGDVYKVKFHMTIAKLVEPTESLRDETKLLRISRATHIELHDLYQRV
jgi:hypothetical protein